MTCLSARSNLVNFSPKKNLTSNGSKPIGVLTRTKISRSDLRLPNAYSLPDFQPHRSNFLDHSPPPPPPLTRKEGGRHWGGSAHPNPPGGIVPIEHLAPIIVWYDQLRDYPINSEFWAKFRFTHKDDENCYKMNLYTYSSFHSQKLPCFQRIIKEGLWSYRFFFICTAKYGWTCNWKKNCVKKIHSNSVPIWLLPKKKSSVISLKTLYRYFRQLLRNFATFLCPTNKDSIQKERFKPIGFLIRVKKV